MPKSSIFGHQCFLFMNGKDAMFPSNAADDEARANLDAILSGGLSLSSLLMPCFDNNNIINSSSSFPSPPLLPSDHHHQPPLFGLYRPDDTFQDPPPAFSSLLAQQLKILPKSEPSGPPPSPFLPPFPPTMMMNTPAFHHLPDLTSLDTHVSSGFSSSPHKRARQQLGNSNDRQLLPVPTSALARQRRSRMSDKTRCLQKLIPLERQMDTATLYEETYKYIKFLEAQISVFQSMPVQAPSPLPTTATRELDCIYGGLGRLNRQQLLQVLMNSQVAQTVMYTNRWCVFSTEQLASLLTSNQHVQEKVVEQQFL